MNQHKYEGSLIACLKCFKKPSDPVHSIEFKAPSLLAINNNQEAPIAVPILFDGKNQAIKPTCKGHICPKCKDTWEHNYNCGSINNGLCEKCAQQNAAEIFRPKHIEEIKESQGTHLTGMEATQLRLQHEEFVVLEIIQDKNGATRTDWQERLAEHIKIKEACIERLRIELASCTRAKARQEVQDLNKLTPEEQEQYRRDAGKLKKPKAEKAPTQAISGSKREKTIVGLLKLLGKEDNATNRRLVEEMTGD